MNETTPKNKALFVTLIFGILAIIVLGLAWFFSGGSKAPVGFGWFIFSFTTGLTMIVLPCTLPLAFVIVPLSMGKGARKGILIALSFGLGVAIMLSAYGVVAAIIGKFAIGALGAPLESLKNWLYFIAGIFVYLFALGQVGLLKIKMPSYTGAVPGFIQKKQDFFKAFLLGLFLGNVGVGCPHPATPLILLRIADTQNVFYGWLLFFVHALGRILPLILLAVLAIAGVNALTWLMARKDKIERATGWGMVFVAGFILVLGLFTHDWWVYSGQHTLLESITGEEGFLTKIASIVGSGNAHHHGVPMGTGLFGLPLPLGNWVLVALWVFPMWWYYRAKRKAAALLAEADPEKPIEKKVRPVRFWLYASLTVLLASTFIWILPDLFLNHANHTEDHAHPAGTVDESLSHTRTMEEGSAMDEMMAGHTDMMEDDNATHESMMGGHTHTSILQEESVVVAGPSVHFSFFPSSLYVPAVGESATLGFKVSTKPANTPINASALQIEHEKLMHVIGVRDDLGEFFHIHPNPSLGDPSLFIAPYTFRSPGAYKVWSEVKTGDVDYVFGHPTFNVGGPGLKSEKNVTFGRSTNVGKYTISMIDAGSAVKGKSTDIYFDVHDLNENEIPLENYLGVPMHLAAIKDDLTQFIHTHPTEAGAVIDESQPHTHTLLPTAKKAMAHGGEITENSVHFGVVFPEAGLYKVFAQFRPKGIDLPSDEALTASFWITVDEKGPAIPRGFLLFFVSAIAAVGLSFGVSKFIKA